MIGTIKEIHSVVQSKEKIIIIEGKVIIRKGLREVLTLLGSPSWFLIYPLFTCNKYGMPTTYQQRKWM